MHMQAAASERSAVRALLFWLGALCLAAEAGFLFLHRGYYFLPPMDRPLHPLYEELRSSGHSGLSFGMIGTALIALNLGYLLRRQWIRAEWLGSLRSWMALHVFTGLAGAGLILLHSALQPRSALGTLSSVSLLIVVATGLLGRYVYSRAPRSVEGRELELEEIRKRLEAYRGELERLGFRHGLTDDGEADAEGDRGLLPAFAGLVAGDRQMRRELEALRGQLHSRQDLRPLTSTLLPLLEKFCRERQWLARYHELRSLMSSWRFLHRWFAVVMLATVAFHIAVAVWLGNLWVLK